MNLEEITSAITGFNLGNDWQYFCAFDDRYYDVIWLPGDLAKVNAIYNAALTKHWPIWRGKIEQTVVAESLGSADFDFAWEGDGLAGAVLMEVFWNKGGVDKLSAVFSGQMGDSPHKEAFELFMADQVRDRLATDIEQLAKVITDPNVRAAVEQWAQELSDVYWS